MKISNAEKEKKTYKHELHIKDYTFQGQKGFNTMEQEVFSFDDYEKSKIKPKNGEKILSKESYTESLYNKLMKDVFSEEKNNQEIKVGLILNGFLHTIDEKNAFIDIGFKDSVVVDRREIEKYNVNVGEYVDVKITSYEDRKNSYLMYGSIMLAMEEGFMNDVDGLIKNQTPLEFYVYEVNDGGFNLKMGGSDLYFFMPNYLAGVNKLSNPKELQNTYITAVIEAHLKDTNTFIVSRRKYLESMIDDKIDSLQYNKSYFGKITGTTDYGVFVEFEECLTGLIHKTNLNPENLPNYDKITAGMEIEFVIKDIFKNDRRIILTQIIRESLWDNISIGQELSGEVKSIKPIGALVQLDDETKGLIPTNNLNKNIKVGQVVNVKVNDINKEKRKIILQYIK